MNIVGLIHPGAMGASVGSAATHNANDVLWASHGRSPENTEKRCLDHSPAGVHVCIWTRFHCRWTYR